MTAAAAARELPEADIRDVLDLEPVAGDTFRAGFVFDEQHALYGGQVAAQALKAAALTVPPVRLPHSLHGYFLRAGSSAVPTTFEVFRDRDGRSYTARRVVAVQRGEIIFNMAASFHQPEEGPDEQLDAMPEVPQAQSRPGHRIPRLFSYEGRDVPSPYDGAEWPTRFWARCEVADADPVFNLCVLAYLSDISSGLSPFGTPTHTSAASLDHAVWFHRPVDVSDWLLVDLAPHTVAGGRGWYTGSVFDRAGRLVASVAQEALFRERRPSSP